MSNNISNNNYKIRSKDIEVEAKYLLHTDVTSVKEQVLQCFIEDMFKVKGTFSYDDIIFINDVYYDTVDRQLLKKGISLRLRHKGDRTFITFKSSLNHLTGQRGQMERFERERKIPAPDFFSDECAEFIMRCLHDIGESDFLVTHDFVKAVTIWNKRCLYKVKKDAEKYQVALDDVTYFNEVTKKKCSEQQLEIEKRSKATSVKQMLKTIKKLEVRLGKIIEPCSESKFERACRLTT